MNDALTLDRPTLTALAEYTPGDCPVLRMRAADTLRTLDQPEDSPTGRANAEITRAMARAGIDGTVLVGTYTDATDCYADYSGWRVQADDEDVRTRAHTWMRKWLAREGIKTDAAFTDGDLTRQVRGAGYERTAHGSAIPTETYATFIRIGRHSLGD